MDPFASFYQLEEAATFFLFNAFEHVKRAMHFEVADAIFGELIKEIDIEPGWIVPSVPTTLSETLRAMSEELQIIPEETLSKLALAMEEAHNVAPSSGIKIHKARAITSIEIVGHVINLAACVEVVIDRHLFLLRESGKLENSLYLSLDRAEVVPKILFAFKKEVQSKKLPTSRLSHLFRLRNDAVHFKASSTESKRPTREELIGIWREVGLLLEVVEGNPTRQDMEALADDVSSKRFR